MLVVGDKEFDSGCPALRRKGKGDLGSINVEDLLRRLKHEIDNKITE
jgi:threonyl-tRNA synthetase